MRPALIALILALISFARAIEVTDLRCEGLVAPVGVDLVQPTLGWQLADDTHTRGQKQTAYQVLVASTAAQLAAGTGDLWDSGRVDSEQSLHVPYAGAALASRQRAHWKVRVWDKDGNPSAWSTPSQWTMGLLHPADWSATWIAHSASGFDGAEWIWFNEGNPASNAPPATRQFRRTVTLPTDRTLISAKVRITADNSFTLTINGQPVASGTEWTQPVAANITSALQSGSNSISIGATNGGTEANPAGLIARFDFTFATGEPLTVATNNSWEASTNGDSWSPALSLGAYGIAPWGSVVGTNSPDPWLLGEFDLSSIPESAIVTVHSHAYFELYVNGEKAGDDVLTPAVSDPKTRTFTVTYDVARLLRSGTNCLGLWMSKGWAERVAVRAQLDAVVGGANFTYGTGLDWKSRPSGYSHIGNWSWGNFGGERIDAAAHLPDWCEPGLDTSSWSNVLETTAPAGPPANHYAPFNRIGARIPAQEITALAGGRYVIDFGTNLTGWLQLKFPPLPAGRLVRMHFADRVFPDGIQASPIGNISVHTGSCVSFDRLDGGFNLYQNYNQTSEFISAGGANEEFHHKFNYAGFRYVVVEGLDAAPNLEDATAMLIESDLADAGAFESSDPLLNRIHQVNRWTMRALNLGSYYVDCPHRERMGYGDGQVALQGMMMSFNAANFYTKWVEDWRLALEKKNESLAFIAPPFEPTGGGPPWPGNIARIPWQHYLHYGNPAILEENIDAARSYCEYLDGRSTNDVLRDWGSGFSFIGDWVPPGRGMDTSNWPSSRMAEFFSNCYRIHLWQLVGKMSTALGRTSEAAHANQRAQAISNAIHAEYFDATNSRYIIDEQIYYAFPLMVGVTPTAQQPAVLENLVRCIVEKNSGHLDTGMLGTMFLMEFLNDIGRDDLILGIYQKKDYPGWGYMVEQGATTLWEQWNGYWSQIHSCFTSADNWLYQGLAGIRPDPAQAGFKNVIIQPAEVGDITSVNASHDGPYGLITCQWQRAGLNVTLNVTIPPNSSGEIHVPASAVGEVTESGNPAATAPGVEFLRMENRHAVFAVGAGTYAFTGTLPVTLGPVVEVPAGSPLALDFSGSQTISALLLDGVLQAPGTYSAATHPDWFTGTGSLLVLPEARTWDNGANTGKWNGTDANWSGESWSPGGNATIANSAAPSTITLEGGLTASSVSIGKVSNNGAYTFTGPGSLSTGSLTIQGASGSDQSTMPTSTFTDATITVSGDLGLGRAGLVIGGNSVISAKRLGGTGIGTVSSADWGTLTLQDSAQLTVADGILGNTTAWGVKLNGGTLTTKGINYGPHAYLSSLTGLFFNGTLVRANQDNPAFLSFSGGDFTAPVVQSGGARIDTNGFAITLGLGLTGPGALTKSGAGTLTLGQASSYQGGTTVSGGTLAVTGTLGSGDLTVSNGAIAELGNASGAIADTAALRLTGSGRIHLAAGVTETVARLEVDGTLRMPGTWNAARDPLHFSGPGNLIVASGGPATPAEAWRFANFASYDNSGDSADDADPDHDGASNLLERALGSDPKAGDASGDPILHPGSPEFSFGFNRSRAATDLTVVVQTSPDLAAGSWRDSTPADGQVQLVDDSDPAVQGFRFTAAPGGTRGFYRLSVR
ncbi:MAG: hypothetical protein EAZ65_02740 [Verrucomicrobia bacterium]|nr:MAG: hypothetical protein EAZ84_10495 [Verrucomicrobiota bacterium]TAE88830.1 MAG: hypothetical protein EAZ82_01985 [Verrucomicrobiota bacterium]TAF27247.1 MAG: hypothetical protein EAZ71_01950 [Verrucomicrobiota bacterium]TAF42462.1 MAG: hypothetical protein EAZ65_02740 [Verrucomicrobiota bacterium]